MRDEQKSAQPQDQSNSIVSRSSCGVAAAEIEAAKMFFDLEIGRAELWCGWRSGLATFRRKNEECGCCGRIAQDMENCKVGRI
jgi:hypothetical protein